MILVIDNYDSFTFNLVQYAAELKESVPVLSGCEVLIFRNDQIDIDRIEALKPSHIIISPGPGTPADAGISNAVIKQYGQTIPVLGVCLGHQCIAELYGARVVRSKEPVHGKTTTIHHQKCGVFNNLPSPLKVTRYHSLIVDASTVKPPLEITAWTEGGLIMGLKVNGTKLEGVQFHPESILTQEGKSMIMNFLKNG
ncbi:aminodeoxychorismate/anthranilate synthase component II [bacterium]|nr:aminodeoxychorismate/anthranilate synthase component II [bacterium]